VKTKSILFVFITVFVCFFVAQGFSQSSSFSLAKKKTIFKALVSAEDSGVTEPNVYAIIAKRYGITARQAEQIADEGIRNMWPTN